MPAPSGVGGHGEFRARLVGTDEPANSLCSEPRRVDEDDDDRGRLLWQRGEASPQRGTHTGLPVRVVDHGGAGYHQRSGTGDDDQRLATSLAKHPDHAVDQPFSVELDQRLGTAEPAPGAGRKDEPGNRHVGCSR